MPQMTKLEAVNRMLRGAGEQPVSTLVDDGTNDVSVAVTILNETSTECQFHNSRVNTTLQRTVDNTILLSDNTLWVQTRDTDANKHVERRGRFLYDVTNNRDTFTADLKVTISNERDFEDLTYAEQLEIADAAAREYQQRVVGDTTADGFLAERQARSQSGARQNETQQGRRGWLDDKYSRAITQRRYRGV